MMGTSSEALGSDPRADRSAPELRIPRIVVSGATGHLGRAFSGAAWRRGFSIVGAIAGPESLSLGRTLEQLGVPGVRAPVDPPTKLRERLALGNVYVACAPASAEAENLLAVGRAGRPVVLATTGFSSAQEKALEALAAKVPVVRESNFSIGLHWLRLALSRAPRGPPGFDRAILEAHRRGKRDRPSGTAHALASELAHWNTLPSGARPTSNESLAIESLRLGELPGIHQIWMGSSTELIRIEHLVLDRRAFAEGMVESVRWLTASSRRAPGWYRLIDVLAPSDGPT
jgi:4-hydroxy-tetrahydrodipicolinate reductase